MCGARDVPFSVRHGSYRSSILTANSVAAAERQTLQKGRGENRNKIIVWTSWALNTE